MAEFLLRYSIPFFLFVWDAFDSVRYSAARKWFGRDGENSLRCLIGVNNPKRLLIGMNSLDRLPYLEQANHLQVTLAGVIGVGCLLELDWVNQLEILLAGVNNLEDLLDGVNGLGWQKRFQVILLGEKSVVCFHELGRVNRLETLLDVVNNAGCLLEMNNLPHLLTGANSLDCLL